MKYIFIILVSFFSLISINTYASLRYGTTLEVEKENTFQSGNKDLPLIKQKSTNNWTVFLINFFIGAIGAFTIYGIAAGAVSAGATYFITNGNKQAFKIAIWGSLLGIAVGLLVRLLTL